jgi:hypothetical protein
MARVGAAAFAAAILCDRTDPARSAGLRLVSAPSRTIDGACYVVSRAFSRAGFTVARSRAHSVRICPAWQARASSVSAQLPRSNARNDRL